MFQILFLAVSYIIGSIPFGFITARFLRNIDIREYGSGNIGATNVARVVGKKWGVIVFVLDFLKGMIPLVCVISSGLAYPDIFYIAMAVAVIAGHNWSIFLHFKGGKGVSTSIGAVSGLCFKYPGMIIPVVVAVVGWGVIFMLWRIVSLASIISAFFFFIVSLFFLTNEFKIVTLIIFVFIIIRHKENIKNIFHKEESSF